jgi:ribonucleotide reductase beta subunit family protein with ferritin-like domain
VALIFVNIIVDQIWLKATIFGLLMNIHSEKYLLLIDTYVKDPTKKMHLLRVIETVPCVQRKAQLVLRWCDSATASFAKCMIAFAAVEGIFFSGSFCAIFWLKKARSDARALLQ